MRRDRGRGRAAVAPAVRRGLVPVLLTAGVAGLIVLAVARGHLVVRDGVGLERVVPVSEVWGRLLERLPVGVPGLPGREAFVFLLALAGVAAAYTLVATLRLPNAERGTFRLRSRQARNAEGGTGNGERGTRPGQARNPARASGE